MATEGGLVRIPGVVAGADLSAQQFRLMKLSTSGKIAVATAQGERTIGVLQNKPNADGVAAEVAVSGVSKVKAGGSITAGDPLTPQADGDAETAASGDYVIGWALEAGTTGQIISMLIQPYGVL